MFSRTRSHSFSLIVAFAAVLLVSAIHPAHGFTIRGVGTANLIGGDLTDPENDGAPDADSNYNATFISSEEPGFGGGEFAFNVFDNIVGPQNAKWCCGDQNNFPTNPISIDATFSQPFVLGRFTITSGNDTPARDPRVWQILGSNDGSTFTPIFSQNDPNASLWGATRDQVLQFDVGTDFAVPAAYSIIRFETTATGATTGARFQLAELEYFAVPEPSSIVLLASSLMLAASRRRRQE